MLPMLIRYILFRRYRYYCHASYIIARLLHAAADVTPLLMSRAFYAIFRCLPCRSPTAHYYLISPHRHDYAASPFQDAAACRLRSLIILAPADFRDILICCRDCHAYAMLFAYHVILPRLRCWRYCLPTLAGCDKPLHDSSYCRRDTSYMPFIFR